MKKIYLVISIVAFFILGLGIAQLINQKPHQITYEGCSDEGAKTLTHEEYVESCHLLVLKANELYEQSQELAKIAEHRGIGFNERQKIVANNK